MQPVHSRISLNLIYVSLCVRSSEGDGAAPDSPVTMVSLYSVDTHTHTENRKETAEGCNRADDDHGVVV